jgi:hypothetical protein
MQCGIGNVRARPPRPCFSLYFPENHGGKNRRAATTCRRAFARKLRDANGKSARAASHGSPDLAVDNRAEQAENREPSQPCFAKHPARAIVNAFRCALVSRAQRSMKRSGMMRCRPGTAAVSGGPGSAVHRSTSLRAAPRPGHAIAADARLRRAMPGNDGCRAPHRALTAHTFELRFSL